MTIDPWLPVGYTLPDGAVLARALYGGDGWQIFEVRGGGHALVVKEPLAGRWLAAGLMNAGVLVAFAFGGDKFRGVFVRRGPGACACRGQPSAADEERGACVRRRDERDPRG